MSQKAEYKSAVRSRRLIKNALIALLREKPLNKITVTDIVSRAQLNRGTFYAHYPDIGSLIQSIEDEIVQTLCDLLCALEEPNPLDAPLPLFLQISEYLEENREVILALMNSHVTNAFFVSLPELITGHLVTSGGIAQSRRSSPEFQTRCRFYAGGAASLYIAWFQGTLDCSLRDIAYILERIIRSRPLS
ncbi:MAG: TetR/AcrR family transcriptional regulator [Roseburia sp.]|nr:TetR/AcrR family transcriptional regulator [Roseburia sp.]